VMYKNPQCSCCEAYAAYLEQNGFKVDIKPVNNLSQISSDAGVPTDLEGCHTIMVDGYVVDGLVPVDVVKKLLTER
ncbi:MAG: CopG family transcriptional regulator, partial [Mesorhizobium sp.]